MLFKIIDSLRSKPKHIRDQYAFGIAVFCTMAIGGIWTLSLPARFAGESQVAALASTTNAAPFSNFLTQLKNQFAGVKETVQELPQATTTPATTASSTEAALDLQLSDENKAQIQEKEMTRTGTKIQFGNGASAETSQSGGVNQQSILVGTSSAVATTTR